MLDEKELENKITELNNLMNKLIDLFNNKDIENQEWKQNLKNNFMEALNFCKPVFTSFLEDAVGVKASIEEKNKILEDLLYDEDYESYYKQKEKYSNINGSCLDNNLSILEQYISIINNCYELLVSIGSILTIESNIYFTKIHKLTSIVEDIEEISYMT